MRILITTLFFILTSCSSYTVASLSSNIITYNATGKTNADHVVSMLMQKDCKMFRAIKDKEVCVAK